MNTFQKGASLKWSTHKHFGTVTSDLVEEPSKPAITLSLPPTTDAWAYIRLRGREARGVQTVAPGFSVRTEERRWDTSRLSILWTTSRAPPATTSACEGLIRMGWIWLSPLVKRCVMKGKMEKYIWRAYGSREEICWFYCSKVYIYVVISCHKDTINGLQILMKIN